MRWLITGLIALLFVFILPGETTTRVIAVCGVLAAIGKTVYDIYDKERERKKKSEESRERVKAIPNLQAASVEADVFERAVAKPRVDPETEDSLIGPAELPGTGQNSAPIDPNRKIKRGAVLQSKTFRSDFRAAIK